MNTGWPHVPDFQKGGAPWEARPSVWVAFPPRGLGSQERDPVDRPGVFKVFKGGRAGVRAPLYGWFPP